MGTRVNALVDHQVSDARDRPAVLAMLEPTIPTAVAIQEHWDNDGPCSLQNRVYGWHAFPERDGMLSGNYLSYDGPGGLFVRFGRKAARIRTRCRWRSFLTEEPLRTCYIQAFRSIAKAHRVGLARLFPE